MTAIDDKALKILDLLTGKGVSAHLDGGDLVLRPASAIPKELLASVRRHRSEIVARLSVKPCKSASAASASVRPDYTEREQRLMSIAPAALRQTVDSLKAAFADMGGATVVDVRPTTGFQLDGRYIASNPRRQPVIDLIRLIEQTAPDRARDLTDAWMERVAICEIDGRLSSEDAEAIALKELKDNICQMAKDGL